MGWTPRAAFFDWHGVLCSQPFWHHLPAEHPVRSALAGVVFSDAATVTAWMRGEIGARQVVEAPSVALGLDVDEVLAELDRSCRLMRADRQVLQIAQALRPQTRLLAIASDNMDCFAAAHPLIDDLAVFDGLMCSSRLHTLKDDPERFFRMALRLRGLSPEQALLVDDRADNCERFRAWGGRAVQFTCAAQAGAEIAQLTGVDVDVAGGQVAA